MKLEELLIRVEDFEEPERLWCLKYDCQSKTGFVNEISKALRNQETLNIEKVELKIFVNKKLLKEHRRRMEEYVVVTYDGGAIGVANNLVNSVSATYRTIGRLLDGGYWGEFETYLAILNNPDYEEVEVE